MNMEHVTTGFPLRALAMWVAASWAAVSVAPADPPAPSADTTGVSADTPEELRGLPARWEAAMKEMGVPGLAVTVVRGDQVFYTATFGERDPEKHLPVTPDTMFYIASCTKSFMAMAMMSLAEAEKIEIDGPVKKYLPRFELSDPSLTQTLTIRDLLSHAKGINSRPMVFLDAFTGEITEDRYYESLKSASIANRFAYTNLHYTLAGRVAEAVTDTPWKDVLQNRIFDPAGMTRTTAYASRMYGDPDSAVPCTTADGRPVAVKVRKTDATMHAAGGMGSSIKDLAKWLRLNLNGGVVDGKRVVSEPTIREMQSTQARLDEPDEFLPGVMREGYGLGWQIGTYKSVPRLEHGGGYVGTSAHISFMPGQHIGVAALGNSSAPLPHIVAMDVYDRLLKLDGDDIMPDLAKRVKQRVRREEKRADAIAKNPLTQKSLSLPIETYTGKYTNSLWGTVVIEREGDLLRGRVGDLPLAFSALDSDRFGVLVGDGDEENGRFELTDETVTAVVIAFDLGDTDVRFMRSK